MHNDSESAGLASLPPREPEQGLAAEAVPSPGRLVRQVFHHGADRTVWVAPVEHRFPAGITAVTESDLDGNIVECGDSFASISGYARQELLGMPHCVLRHPDMPRAMFREMWASISVGRMWRGVIKNLHKDGGYYLCDALIVPKVRDDHIFGYVCTRRKPTIQAIHAALAKYQGMLSATEKRKLDAHASQSGLANFHPADLKPFSIDDWAGHLGADSAPTNGDGGQPPNPSLLVSTSSRYMVANTCNVPLDAFLQTLAASGKSATVWIGNLDATIHIARGRFRDARAGMYTGQDALVRILLLAQGAYSVQFDSFPADAGRHDVEVTTILLACSELIDRVRWELDPRLHGNPKIVVDPALSAYCGMITRPGQPNRFHLAEVFLYVTKPLEELTGLLNQAVASGCLQLAAQHPSEAVSEDAL